MPRYVVSILPGYDAQSVVDAMRRAGADVRGVFLTPTSKRTSGRLMIECIEELAVRLREIEGVQYFEKEVLFHLISR
mgnify:CR=1 FL=1